jgi:hypothetical protein
MIFTKEVIDEIKDALGDSLNYYKDLLDVNSDGSEDLETNKKNIEYTRSRIKIIESMESRCVDNLLSNKKPSVIYFVFSSFCHEFLIIHIR